MTSAGFGSEEGVECDDAVDGALGDAECLGDVVLEFFGKIAVKFLGLVEHRDEGTALGLFPGNHCVQLRTMSSQIQAHIHSMYFPMANDQSRMGMVHVGPVYGPFLVNSVERISRTRRWPIGKRRGDIAAEIRKFLLCEAKIQRKGLHVNTFLCVIADATLP